MRQGDKFLAKERPKGMPRANCCLARNFSAVVYFILRQYKQIGCGSFFQNFLLPLFGSAGLSLFVCLLRVFRFLNE
jgi:hypothetical protein